MLATLKTLFQKSLADVDESDTSERNLQMAAAMLFVEVMHADHLVEKQERRAVVRALQATFGLQENAAQLLLTRAEKNAEDVVSLHEFASQLHHNLTEQQKLLFLEHIWRIVFADDEMDKYEEHLVRRIADLLYISHSDYIRTKHRAQE